MKLAIGAAIIENRKLLLVRKKQSWILPGGKPEPNESDLECLCREVREELSGTRLKDITYYKEFKGITPYKGYLLRAKIYFAGIEGDLHASSAEINASEWFDRNNANKYNLSEITLEILNSLIKDGYIQAF